MMLGASKLREILHYDVVTGVFTWRISPTKSVKPGSVAGGFTDRGYWRISIGNRRYKAHRLAFLYMTGKWPTNQVDHINGDRADNAWRNLRQADNAQNSANSKRYRNNTSGVKGVSWDRARQKWAAYITVGYKRTALGRFPSREEAAAAYAKAADKEFGEFARPA